MGSPHGGKRQPRCKSHLPCSPILRHGKWLEQKKWLDHGKVLGFFQPLVGWVERGGELKKPAPKIQKAKKDYYEAHYDPENKAFPKDGVVSWGPGLALERVGPEKIP